jgi:hypothetical protein
MVLTPNTNQNVTVNQPREVRHDGALVANPTTAATRPNRTITSVQPIALPPGVGWGIHEVTTTVAVGDRSSLGPTTFVVR